MLQAVPTFLWLRAHFGTSTTRRRPRRTGRRTCGSTSRGRSANRAGSPQVNRTSCASPGGDQLVASAKAAPAASAGVRSTAAPVASRNAPPPSPAGSVSVVAPVPMQVYAKGRLIGTTKAKTITLPVGNHDLDFVSEDVGYRAKRSVAVHAAQTIQVRLEAPMGMLSVNATPWAEVWIDNQRIGETPIGNFRAAIGQREVLFRHPKFGERRATVLVTLKQPARISMDFTKR